MQSTINSNKLINLNTKQDGLTALSIKLGNENFCDFSSKFQQLE